MKSTFVCTVKWPSVALCALALVIGRSQPSAALTPSQMKQSYSDSYSMISAPPAANETAPVSQPVAEPSPMVPSAPMPTMIPAGPTTPEDPANDDDTYCDDLAAAIAAKQGELAKLQSDPRLARYSELFQQVQTEKEFIRQTEFHIADLKAQIARNKADLGRYQAILRATTDRDLRNMLQMLINQLKAENEQFNKSLTAKTAELAQAQANLDKLEKELQDLEKQVQDLRKQIKDLEDTLMELCMEYWRSCMN